MEIKKNQIFKTPVGLILKVKTVRESGLHTLELIDEKGNIIPERRNHRGHVIERSVRICSEETIRTFKKLAIGMLLLFCSMAYSQKKKFVMAADSKHKVLMIGQMQALSFDDRIYSIDKKRGWYVDRNDTVIWVYGHNPLDFKDVVKVGFYKDFQNYVVSLKTEKLKNFNDVTR
ncbi:hypothetical protein [Flavobacterium]|nr:hypothetical protein [Flavobacterium]